MSWAVGFDQDWQRDIGYGVPALCDHPKCNAEIDRGLGYVCGGKPRGGETGCGLYFCSEHLRFGRGRAFHCTRCLRYKPPYNAKPDVDEWVRWKLTHDSWAEWREEHPAEVKALRARVELDAFRI
jgi:hypothetical protein